MPVNEAVKLFGIYIHTRFKKQWVLQQNFPENTLLPDIGCAIVRDEVSNEKIVVNAYPDSFKNDMATMADVFFFKQLQEKEKRQRKRIPVGEKAYSAKPTSNRTFSRTTN